MSKPRKNVIKAGTTVVVPQNGRELAGRVVGQSFAVTIVRLIEGPNTGRALDFPTSMVRIPAAFETIR